ncbi:hypothetical protein OKW49_008122 [Paraburkholderia youngii]|uniref:DUF4148 domain-containing protein n=1 Tax=Paraburkholderia youngii TaxID=2782701 RepID=UPI003D227359
MQSLPQIVLIACLLGTPIVASAQTASNNESTTPLSRAQVQDDLIRLEQAGYRPSKLRYPADIQEAEAKLAASGDVRTEVGGAPSGASASGNPAVSQAVAQAIYSHH